MKRYYPIYFLILIMMLSWPLTLFSQESSGDEPCEKVVLFSDRSLFISGEQIQFFAKVFSNGATPNSKESMILYCELITAAGNKISGNKYLFNQNSVTGCITIPSEQVSGIYYLRAYTKLMRNFGPETYAYIQVKVVNPYREDLLSVDNTHDNRLLHIEKAKDSLKFDLFLVEMEKRFIASGESVSLKIKPSIGADSIFNSLCISVIPETAIPFHIITQLTKPHYQLQTSSFYAENRGLSLSGKLTGEGGGSLQDKVVNLSIIGEGRDFMASRTDSSGKFFFALPPYSGNRDVFLCVEKAEQPGIKIWVDNDFCSSPVHISAEPFSLSEIERQVALNMAQNCQVETHFRIEETLVENNSASAVDQPFYGNPTAVLKLDQYVQLPTLEEYFNELPGLVKVRKRSGGKYFKVIGSDEISFYDPLVLVDLVAVDEPERLLAVAPQNISKIEIVNRLYVKGGQTYGGIISILSKKGDFAGIDLPSAGIFINFKFLDQGNCYPAKNNTDADLPDVRNLLLWEPGIHIPLSGESKYSFPAPYAPGKYSVVLQGVLNDGSEFIQTKTFEVGN